VAECFWPGVTASDVEALDARARALAAGRTRTGERVRYLGSILMREDEVVLCQFEGTAAAVREIAERAEIPFERILEATRSSESAADVD
jgi:Nickel responsive protein SCO4226-like